VPLDIYVMLDASGSMTDKAGTMGQGVEEVAGGDDCAVELLQRSDGCELMAD
jgi:hypothetical protein